MMNLTLESVRPLAMLIVLAAVVFIMCRQLAPTAAQACKRCEIKAEMDRLAEESAAAHWPKGGIGVVQESQKAVVDVEELEKFMESFVGEMGETMRKQSRKILHTKYEASEWEEKYNQLLKTVGNIGAECAELANKNNEPVSPDVQQAYKNVAGAIADAIKDREVRPL